MRIASYLALSAALIGAVAHAQDSEPERLRLHGSNILAEGLVPDLAESWLRDIGYTSLQRRRVSAARLEIAAVRDGERVVVEIDGRGTATGLHDIVAGDAEIALAVRPPNARELDEAWQLGDLHSAEQEWVLGLDGVVVLVAPGNPLRELSLDQLRGVLSGRISNWSQLGAPAGPIHLHGPMPGTATRELASQLVLDGRPLAALAAHARYSQVTNAVAVDPQAIGLVDLRAARGAARALAIRAGDVAVAPELLSIASEDYPLTQRVHLYTGQLITALGRGFALWSLTAKGQAVVARSRFVPLAVQAFAPTLPERAPRDYRGFVEHAQRLGMTIRFGRGLDLLDSRSRQDMDRLGAWLRQPENRGRNLLLMGFADPQPRTPFQALTLSQERVDFVAGELAALNARVVTVRGFGGKLSLAGSTGAAARYRNDRVEIWVR